MKLNFNLDEFTFFLFNVENKSKKYLINKMKTYYQTFQDNISIQLIDKQIIVAIPLIYKNRTNSKKFRKIILLCETDDYSNAKIFAIELINEFPLHSENRRLFAHILVNQNEIESAEKELISSLRLDPSNFGALRQLYSMYLGDSSDIKKILLIHNPLTQLNKLEKKKNTTSVEKKKQSSSSINTEKLNQLESFRKGKNKLGERDKLSINEINQEKQYVQDIPKDKNKIENLPLNKSSVVYDILKYFFVVPLKNIFILVASIFALVIALGVIFYGYALFLFIGQVAIIAAIPSFVIYYAITGLLKGFDISISGEKILGISFLVGFIPVFTYFFIKVENSVGFVTYLRNIINDIQGMNAR